MSAWNGLDWALVAVVAASVVAAALKGLFRELIALATVVAGLVIAALGYAWAAAWFEDLTRTHAVALAAGFLALFLGVLLLGSVAAAIVRRLIQTAGLESFDRFLGGIFGFLRGVLVDCVLLMVLVAFAIKPQTVEQSVLAPYVTAGARVIVWVMPRDLKAQFQTGFAKFRNALIKQDQEAAKP